MTVFHENLMWERIKVDHSLYFMFTQSVSVWELDMDSYTFLEVDDTFQDMFKACHVPNLLGDMRNDQLFAF